MRFEFVFVMFEWFLDVLVGCWIDGYAYCLCLVGFFFRVCLVSC